nr:murein L,D-transpeptidase catalytic domain family protein [Legionella spiritensis]
MIMFKTLLLLLAVSRACFSESAYTFSEVRDMVRQNEFFNAVIHYVNPRPMYPISLLKPVVTINQMLHEKKAGLRKPVISKVLTALRCAKAFHMDGNGTLTIIDYSLPSSEKRLWVFDLHKKTLIFHTYVSHGITSGARLSRYFSNKYNSKASSIGVYFTEQAYYGRHGLSLRLAGLDRGFNDNASNRYVVMHGGWYVSEKFIKKYGRAGRSWGCPAVPEPLSKAIINTIKEKSFLVAYYPSDGWFTKSRFLNCDSYAKTTTAVKADEELKPTLVENQEREAILFADINKNNRREEQEPIVVMAADTYQRVFHNSAPLERMLRRRINDLEYIALSKGEFNNMIANSANPNNGGQINLDAIYFVIPVVKMQRGYYATEMHIVPMGKILEVKPQTNSADTPEPITSYTVRFDAKPAVQLKLTDRFIRWLGL